MSRKNEYKERQLPLNFEVIAAPAPLAPQVASESAAVVCFTSFARSKLSSSSHDPVLDRLLREATRLSW